MATEHPTPPPVPGMLPAPPPCWGGHFPLATPPPREQFRGEGGRPRYRWRQGGYVVRHPHRPGNPSLRIPGANSPERSLKIQQRGGGRGATSEKRLSGQPWVRSDPPAGASHPRCQGSEPAADEGVSQQVLGRRPPLLLHEDLLEEVAAGAGDAVGELGVGRLRGDFKNRRHGLELCPGRLLR